MGHGMSGDPFLSIYLPSNKESLLVWRCLTGGAQCSAIIFLTKEELEAHIATHGGPFILRQMNNPKTCDRVYERVCRICMKKADVLEGHECNVNDFAPTEDAPDHEEEKEESMERQTSSPSSEVEMIGGSGGSHLPKSPTNDLLHQQVEEILNRSKEITEGKLEVKVETVRKSRKDLEKKKRKKRGERSSSSSSSSSSASSSSSSSRSEEIVQKKKRLQPRKAPRSAPE